MSPRPHRERQIPNLHERILHTAWQQIAAEGAAALSLRAIARQLGITAPAIYRYYPDRDALVTALIVDAFTSFAAWQAAALEGTTPHDHAGRLCALGLAYRAWAVAHPERYQLIFGTPIAGYHAPLEITMPAAQRGLSLLIQVLAQAHAAGKLRPLSPVPLPAVFDAEGVDPQVLFAALTLWCYVHGMVSNEIGRQYPPVLRDAEVFYRHALQTLTAQYLL
ncbi:MAG: TetR/AcrR family transcriptional regulator [Anaerolineae bacterium]|nr:TetR/AcrR family transcriptional regulator [Anaerolineae bacterium]